MKSESYAKYYEANRDRICARMRDRARIRRAERKESYASNPDAITEDREKYRSRYYIHRTNQVRKLLQSVPPTPTLTAILSSEELLRALTPKMAAVILQNSLIQEV